MIVSEPACELKPASGKVARGDVGGVATMTFGERVRELRRAKGLTLRSLAGRVAVSFTCLSKIENAKLAFGEYPGEGLILKLAKALGAVEDELLLLAEKV